MKSFKEWLEINEIVGIYPALYVHPALYDGLSAYPDLYFVNSSYKVYIDASLKAKTNPPKNTYGNLKIATPQSSRQKL
jgi:hypothetical protein